VVPPESQGESAYVSAMGMRCTSGVCLHEHHGEAVQQHEQAQEGGW